MKRVFLSFFKLTLLGLIVGLFIAGYQFVGHEVISLSKFLLNNENLIWISTIFISVILLIGLMLVNKKISGYYGSGIPQIEAYHQGWYNFNPYKMLILMTVNSIFAFFGGFLLGSEGPSVSIGASIGMIGNDIFKDDSKEDVAITASTGFACAFSSPLAGLCHLIEENKKILSFKLILKGIWVISVGFFIGYLAYPHSLLPYFELTILPFKYYIILLIMVIICVIISKVFLKLIMKVKDFTKSKQFMFYFTPMLLILFMLLRRFFPLLVGSGLDSIDINILDYSLLIIFSILLFRLIFTSLSMSSNISGGAVLPTLAIGSLTAILFIKAVSHFIPEITNYVGLFLIVGMLVTFAVVTNAPITAFVLGLKCASFKVIALPLFISLAISTLLFYVFKWENLYHQLEKRIPGYIHD